MYSKTHKYILQLIHIINVCNNIRPPLLCTPTSGKHLHPCKPPRSLPRFGYKTSLYTLCLNHEQYICDSRTVKEFARTALLTSPGSDGSRSKRSVYVQSFSTTSHTPRSFIRSSFPQNSQKLRTITITKRPTRSGRISRLYLRRPGFTSLLHKTRTRRSIWKRY